ncbi:MAG: flavin reductase family protein [Bacteroidia bacterium]|nr:flavin reductase family protein [Bacteroidia bacterium]
MFTIDPKEQDLRTVHSYLLAAVAPRPIAFASTIDKKGKVNLSPFSFFNVFSAKPPIMIFSPARSGRTGETKHSYQNVKEVPEVVINIVNMPMVDQMNLASSEFDKGVNEFTKAGFTELKSDIVKPPRVAESPAQFECKVRDVVELGDWGGAGNLIVCEVLKMHFNENILDENNKVDTEKIDLVGRMGSDFYVHANKQALFKMKKPVPGKLGIGLDKIPKSVLESKLLSLSDLAKLGSAHTLPVEEEIEEMKTHPEIQLLLHSLKDKVELEKELHEIAGRMIMNDNIEDAWKVLMIADSNSV